MDRPPARGPAEGPARRSVSARAAFLLGVLAVAAVLAWQAFAARGAPDPAAAGGSALVAVFDVGVLTFREGLECILVLAAITASMVGSEQPYRRPVAAGAAAAFGATVATWFVAAGILGRLSESVPALDLQAATGLLAILVLLLVMNWFFHKVYWTGWIGAHTRRKKALMAGAGVAGRRADEPAGAITRRRLLWGLALLGFTSLYREGFEVVLFLQSYRLQLGNRIVLRGVTVGLALTAVVGVLTFVAQRRLPYRRMLVLTGVLLGGVLLVMVGEQAQEMQLAHWIPTTTIGGLRALIPGWAELWFSVFPTVQTLGAQLAAGLLVIGSYAVARSRVAARAEA
ncbi:MAG: FTR1 family protein [Gemmatimonadota bacterium]|nr:FTR1 family protein [Gemmatimonadota bacterium]MDE3217598.1 FTR1 family protein [Gemmatimonadota bacterium]